MIVASRSSGSPRLISDRLGSARRARFVGRAAELDLFRSAAEAHEPPFVVLHVHGPGGIGKTALLRQCAGIAKELDRPVVWIDARDLDARPEVFLAALGQALDAAPNSAKELAACWPARGILIVDTFEAIDRLEAWLRDELLPHLPAGTLVVVAGRHALSPAWMTDIEWAPLVRCIALRNLSPAQSQAYLSLRGVGTPHHAQILSATYGHPLALSLVADAFGRERSDAAFDFGNEPDTVRILLQKLVDDVPSAQHRLALYACAILRVTTESDLAAALECADASPYFEWLGELSFIEHDPHGMYPHDLVREVLYADLRWRNPEQRRALNARLLAHLYERLRHAEGLDLQRIWYDLIYVQRYNAGMRPFYAWSSIATVYAVAMQPEDVAPILEMTELHEGAESAAIARYWLERQPRAFLAFHDLAGQLVGYAAMLRLENASDEDARADPAVAPALDCIRRLAPLRAGEEIAYVRFAMRRDGYQANPATMNVLAANASLYWTSHPKMAWALCALCDAEHFEPMFTSIHFPRLREAEFEVGGRHYGVFAHDWRVETIAQWMMAKVDRASQHEPTATESAPPLLVLSESDFAESVRRALRDFTSDDALVKNPLMRTRLVLGPAAGPATVARLRELIVDAAGTLAVTPKDNKLHLAVLHTHLQPSRTQEQAAELLGCPFNTYRYRLAQGTRRITEWLWQREIEGH